MSFYSPQLIYCNACGKNCNVPIPTMIGRHWKVCSRECNDEMHWRETLSIMNKPYHPKPPDKKSSDHDTPRRQHGE